MATFLREHQVASTFRTLKRGRTGCVIAAPYWGTGAVEELALRSGVSKVVCNLASAGCNPYEIERICRLQSSRGLRVKTHPRLHAKLYIGDQFAIVGSSNPSTGGLMMDGSEHLAWLEANVLHEEDEVVADVNAFFRQIWSDREAKVVTESMIERAKIRWNERPRADRDRSRQSLFDMCRAVPTLYNNVYVALYNEDLDQADKRIIKTFQSSVKKGDIEIGSFKSVSGYRFDERIPINAWLIDVKYGVRPRYGHCWNARVRTKDGLVIAARGKINLSDGRTALPSRAEQSLLLKHGNRLAARGRDLLPLSKAIEIIDRAEVRR